MLWFDCVIDFHSPTIDLGEVVVFYGASSGRFLVVDYRGSTKIGTVVVGVKSSAD